jgi:PAS domain S-box-containing protein
MITQTDRHSISLLRPWSKAGSTTVIVVGLLVLVGWTLNFEILKRGFPGLASMKANTAIAFILSGTALWLLQADQAGPRTRPIARACAFIVTVIGAITLIEYQFGWDFGIDQLLFKEPSGPSDDAYPGRMSPASALNFILIGCALLLLGTNCRILPAQYLVLGAALVSMIALVGHTYGVKSLYSISVYTTMAFHTTLTFLVLCFGILAAYPEQGLMTVVTSKNTGSALARRLIPFAILVPLVGGWLRVKGQDAGFYGTGLGTALSAVTLMLMFVTVIGWAARSLSQSDEKRTRVEEEMERLAKTLEQRVTERTAQLEASQKAALNLVVDTEEARRKAAQAEQQFRALLEFAPDAHVIINQAGTIARINSQTEKLFGYTRQELLGQSIEFLVPERFRGIHSSHRVGFFANPQTRAMGTGRELYALRKDGSEFPTEISLSPMETDEGLLVMAAIRDVTERKRAEDELRKSEEKYHTLFDSIDEGVCTVEMLFDGNEKAIDYRFLEVNPSFEKQTGIRNARGRRMREIAPLHEEHWFEIYGKIAVTGEPIRFENQAAQLGRWYEVYALRVGEPKDGHVAILFKDITERKRAEEALRRAHDQLEIRVQERTAEILAKTRDLETLLYVTSHDLREPLRSIDNFSRMVHDRYADRLDDKGRDFLQRVVRGTHRMDQLITDIVTLSRVQRMEGAVEDIQGESIVTEVLRRLEDKIKETCATVRVVKPLPHWQGNRTWATQGIYNLIANALKFRRNGEVPHVEIASYHPTVEDGPVVGIVVRDRGPGVAAEHAERIFQLFQRAVGREVEGTGAGLAIVRQVAERHGGRAWVQSRGGGGSEFILTFGVTKRQKGSDAHDESVSRNPARRRQ